MALSPCTLRTMCIPPWRSSPRVIGWAGRNLFHHEGKLSKTGTEGRKNRIENGVGEQSSDTLHINAFFIKSLSLSRLLFSPQVCNRTPEDPQFDFRGCLQNYSIFVYTDNRSDDPGGGNHSVSLFQTLHHRTVFLARLLLRHDHQKIEDRKDQKDRQQRPQKTQRRALRPPGRFPCCKGQR